MHWPLVVLLHRSSQQRNLWWSFDNQKFSKNRKRCFSKELQNVKADACGPYQGREVHRRPNTPDPVAMTLQLSYLIFHADLPWTVVEVNLFFLSCSSLKFMIAEYSYYGNIIIRHAFYIALAHPFWGLNDIDSQEKWAWKWRTLWIVDGIFCQ